LVTHPREQRFLRGYNDKNVIEAPPSLVEEYPGLNIALWILQILLAVAFAAHGVMMLAPPPEVAEQMNATLPRWFQVSLGSAEVAAGIGLILPGVTRTLPFLVSWAALGIAIVMVLATIFHAVRGENSSGVVTFVLLLMAAAVAYARSRVLPIAPRHTRNR
jgi:uncharacterized membrane protein YphA (DoxX/SURF4 family)